jgi:hypothetical protein
LIEHVTADLREAYGCRQRQINRYKSLLTERNLSNFVLVDEDGNLNDEFTSLINDDNFLSKISTTSMAFRELYNDTSTDANSATEAITPDSDADVGPELCEKALDIAEEYRSLRSALLELRKQRFELQRSLDRIEMLLAFLEVLGPEEISVFLGRYLNRTLQDASKFDNDRPSNTVDLQSNALRSDLDIHDVA